MTKMLTIIAFIFGLLKFAEEAPKLLSDLFGGGDLFKKFDPRGKLVGDIKSGVSNGAKLARGAGNALASPFRTAAGVGKAIAGAGRGLAAGGSKQKGIHKVGGALRGMVAGGRAAYNTKGFRGTIGNAAFAGAGAGAISNANRTAYGSAQGNLNTTVSALSDLNKAAIDKQKDKKKALEAQHNANKANYVTSHIAEHEKNHLEQAINNELQSRITGLASRTGMSADDIRNNKNGVLDRLKNQVLSDATFMTGARTAAAADAAAQRATYSAQADAAFDAAYNDEKSKIDNEIAKLLGSGFANHTDVASKALQEFARTKGDWGSTISEAYDKNFNSKLHDDHMDANIAAAINSAMHDIGATGTFAGAGATGKISEGNVADLIKSIEKLQANTARTATQDAQLANQSKALGQIMDMMNSAAKKTDSNISLANTALNTYGKQQSENNGGSGGNS